jgi:hypothetical protein
VTYCFVFNTEPDGLGVIADTRLSELDLSHGIRPLPGQVAKVYALGQRAFVAIAGRTDHVALLLHGMHERLKVADDANWYDLFIESCERNFRVFCETGIFSRSHPPEAALIYGDVRHHRGETRCRAVKLEFGFTSTGPARVRQNIGPGQADSIGWSVEGRNVLDAVAKNALGDLRSRSLVITKLTEQDIVALGHVTAGGGARVGFELDATGNPDGSFCPVLRRLANDRFPFGGPFMALEPVTLLAGAAQKAVFEAMVLKGQYLVDSEGVGEFHSASLTLRHGFRIYNGEHLAAISLIRTSISASL